MRTFLYAFVISGILFNCSVKNKTTFLQPNTVSLAQPRVMASNNLIDSFVTISANLKLDGISIHYTSNGEEPTLLSPKYKYPIKASEPIIYKFKAFHPDCNPSETMELPLYKKGLNVDAIVWHTNPNEKYAGQGPITLINDKLASFIFSDSQWVGFDSLASATISFKKKTFVESISLRYLNDMASWIFPPESVSVYIDEEPFYKNTTSPELLKEMLPREIKSISLSIKKEVTSLRIEVNNLKSIPAWHEGQGQKAWLFMDEWIVN
ncbi:MAG: chitobiase/beta-hexosaminidase C-terminal domain-containing protein [Flavobacteriaceae bacterium]|nr:chitobiase/beta-hexosaminidase C-terminal domain-containing protein [Flavobacteriaceae bacterium]